MIGLATKVAGLVLASTLAAAPLSPADYTPSFSADFTMLGYGVPEIPGLTFYDTSRAGLSDAHFIAYNQTLISVGNYGMCGAYAEENMGAPVTRIGVDFKISPGVYGGALALALWSHSWAGPDYVTGVPDAPAHVVITLNDWAFQVFRNGVNIGVAQGTFNPPLPPNMPLRADLRLDRWNGIAYLSLPNGQVVTINDARVKLAANYAVFESWRMNASAGMGQAQIITAWSDTR